MMRYLLLFFFTFFVSQFTNAQTCVAADNIYQNSSNNVTVVGDHGQSFKATCNGNLLSLRVWTNGVSQNINGTLKIYEGTFNNFHQGADLNLPILHLQNFNWNTSSGETEQTIVLSAPMAVVSGQVYTFMLLETNGRTTFSYQDNNQTYTDGDLKERSGNFWYNDSDDDLKFQVHYTDKIPPVARCKNATIYLDANGNANLSHTQINNGSSGGTSYNLSQETFNCNNLGANTVTLGVLDNAGNGASCQSTVTVKDNIAPVNLTCPSDIVINNCGNAVMYDIPTFTDNTESLCGLTIERIAGFESGQTFPINQTTTVTYRATDGSGLYTDCSFTVTSQDIVFPTVSGIPEDQTIYLTDSCKAFIDAYTPTSSDNCPGLITTPMTGISGTGPFPLGATVNTFSYTDTAGNTTTKSFTVTVIDNQNPKAACKDVNLVLDESGLGTVNINQINNGSSDNCTITSTSLSVMSYSGSITTSDTIDHLLGNSAIYYVKSYSFVAPTTNQYEFKLTGESGDNHGSIMSLWNDVPVRDSGHFTSRTEYEGYTARNNDGSFKSGTQFYNLIAGKTYYFDITSNTPGKTVAPYNGNIVVNGTNLNFSCNPGAYPVELLLEDSSGNTSSCTSTITVTKTALAFDACPSNEKFSVDANSCTAAITFTIPTLTNTSCGAIVTQTKGLSSGSEFPVGDTIMEFAATNDLGETTTCSFTYTVEDNEVPTVTCIDNIQVDNSATGEGVVVNYTNDFSDNCTDSSDLIITQVTGLSSGSIFPIGTTFNEVKATDASGNSRTCSLYVTVKDTFNPVATCQNITVDIANTTGISPIDLDNGSTDNSGAVNLGFLASSISGKTTLDGSKDIYEGGGLDIHYVQVYAFKVLNDGFFELSVSGTTSSPSDDNFYLSLYDQRPILMTGDGNKSNPGYISNSFTLFNGDGSPNDGPAEFNLVANKTYFVEISAKNHGITADFKFSLGGQDFITTEAFLSFNCNDIGTANQTLYAFDDSGNMDSCSATISVTNSVAADAVCNSAYVSSALIAENNGKIYPQDITEGSIGYTGFSTNTIQETLTSNSSTIKDEYGDTYYFKRMVFMSTTTETREFTYASNKLTTFLFFDEDNIPIYYSESIGGVFTPANDQRTESLLLEANKVYYGYSLIKNNIDLTQAAQLTLTWSGSPIISTLASIEPDPNVCQLTQELFAFDDCGTSDSCSTTINLDTCFDDAFATTWRTKLADESITIFTNTTDYPTGYDYTIIWGDGEADFNVTGNISHEYKNSGDYSVKILGDFPQLSQDDNFANASKLLFINHWGTIEWQSMESAFEQCTKLKILATDIPDLSNVISTKKMFRKAWVLSGNLNTWDVSMIKDMSEMFTDAREFNEPLNNWIVSNVEDMTGMFSSTYEFNQPLNNWVFSKVLTMKAMFAYSNFNQNIDDWDVSTVTRMDQMFRNSNFDQSIGGWDIGDVTTMSRMFEDSELSTANYDTTLMGWSTLDAGETQIPTGIIFAGGNSKYCAGEDARNLLTNILPAPTGYGWTVEDGDMESPSICNGVDDGFETTWKTTSPDESITIYTNPNEYTYKYDIIWGDGQTDFNVTGDITHQYLTSDDYVVKIIGAFPYMSASNLFSDSTNANKLQSIDEWGTIEWQSMEYTFALCSNLQLNAIDIPDLSLVKSTTSMFYGCTAFTGNDSMDSWDMTAVNTIRTMFYQALNFNAIIGGWNVSNVTNMSSLFFSSNSFNQDLNAWNVENVTNMSGMFASATDFNGDISGWNVENVNNMESMFFEASDFNRNIGAWNVGKVPNMEYMFYNATNFNQNIGAWNVSKVTSMSLMFYGATDFDQNLGTWDISALTTASNMFRGGSGLSTANYDATLIGWSTLETGEIQIPSGITFHGGYSKYCAGEDARNLLINALPVPTGYGWTIIDEGLAPPSVCNGVDNGFETTWKTRTANESITIYTNSNEYTYNYDIIWGDGQTDYNVTGDITHEYLALGDYTVKIIGEFPQLKQGNNNFFLGVDSSNAAKLQSINKWGNIEWKSMGTAFLKCSNVQLLATDNPDLTLVKDTSFMFNGCEAFTGNESMNNWNMITIETMKEMFESTSNFNANIGGWNVSNVTDMFGMFLVSTSFNQDLNSWNVGKVISMKSMFHSATSFNGNISGWNVEKLKNMENMFWGAVDFNQNIGGWNVSEVTDMSGVFYNATEFNQDISNWILTNVLETDTMFRNASSFNQDIGNWDVGKVTNMYEMFAGTTSFDQNIGVWDISALTNASFMFTDVELSVTNYDALLMGWSTLDTGETQIPTNIVFSAGNSKYCAGEDALNKLETTHSWTITGNGSCKDFFITTWKITTANESITIPTSGGGYNYSVDWGDDTNDTNITGDATHTYAVAGTYTVSITSGTFPRIYFENSSDKAKILTVEQWGNNKWSSMFRAFRNCSNLDVVATDVPDLSNVGHIGSMFFGCSNLIGNEIFNDWDISNISNLGAMFQNAVKFNQPLSNWDVSKVIKFNGMFQNATSFNQSLASWDISSLLNTNVTNATNMFSGTTLSTENYDATLIGWATLEAGEIRIPQGITFSGGNSNYCLSDAQRQDLIDTHGWIITDGDKQCDVLLSPKVYLQGAALNPNAGEEALMRDDLRVGGNIPTTSPYTDNLICTTTVFNTIGNDAVVDWVWVELRDATDDSIIASQSALLQRDGDIVRVDGISPLRFNSPEDNYNVVINHRNHISIKSATVVSLSASLTTIDFSNSASTVTGGVNAVIDMGNSIYAMPSGDYDGNGQIQTIDTSAVISVLGSSGYHKADMDMNGEIQTIDINNIINKNVGKGQQF